MMVPVVRLIASRYHWMIVGLDDVTHPDDTNTVGVAAAVSMTGVATMP
jgi:hypothetical protein